MITTKFLVFLLIGTLAMLIPLILSGRVYAIKTYKCVIVALCLTLVGTAGTYIMGLVENQFRFGSRSFYGAVFLIPIIFAALCFLIRVPYGKLMDMSAPSVCIMLVLMRVLCLLEGCCGGRVLFTVGKGVEIRFPSQIIELITAAIIFALLMYMIYKKSFVGKIYAWYMILYGASRFVLNFMRADLVPFVWVMPAGHFWSLICLLAGVLWLVCLKKKQNKIS